MDKWSTGDCKSLSIHALGERRAGGEHRGGGGWFVHKPRVLDACPQGSTEPATGCGNRADRCTIPPQRSPNCPQLVHVADGLPSFGFRLDPRPFGGCPGGPERAVLRAKTAAIRQPRRIRQASAEVHGRGGSGSGVSRLGRGSSGHPGSGGPRRLPGVPGARAPGGERSPETPPWRRRDASGFGSVGRGAGGP